jgi:diacylglycerol kinase family enzyme
MDRMPVDISAKRTLNEACIRVIRGSFQQGDLFMNVLVMNPNAKRLKSQKKRHRIIELIAQSGKPFSIVCVSGKQQMFETLVQFCRAHCVTQIYVAGGDGTFRDIMDWLIKEGLSRDIKLTYLGGGEFCYMRKFFRLPSPDPLKNLRQIFSGRLMPQETLWRPIEVYDVKTQHRQYCSVFANGIIFDFLRWYEDKGKGSVLAVLWLLFSSVVCVLSERFRKWHGRLDTTTGQVTLDGRAQDTQQYMSLVVGAVPELMMWCRPFRGQVQSHQTSNILYWGSFLRLACSIPFIYFGKTPSWLHKGYVNESVEYTVLETLDACVSMDGDTIEWPHTDPTGCEVSEHRFEMKRGPDLHLVTYV